MEPYGPPLEADGIRARSRRGSIGDAWWSRRFIDLVESFADTGRLQRGRAYARQGQVLDLRVTAGEVTARVQGSREGAYEVALSLATVPDHAWAVVERDLSARAVFRARLLAGEMPPEIEVVVAEAGHPLFPMTASDLHMMCDCPDWGDPCKHAAAVMYLLAEAFDDDPFLILKWNGRTREQLLTALRRLPAAGPEPVEAADPPFDAETFWTAPSSLASLRERPRPPSVPPGFVLEIGDLPPVKVRRRGLADVLMPAYEALAEPHEPPE